MQFANFATKTGGEDFNGLYDYVKNRSRYDFVLPVSDLQLEPDTGKLLVGDNGFHMTEFASEIICRELKMPATYISNVPNELAAQNFNFHLPSARGNTKVIVEIVDGVDIVVGFTAEKINPVPIDLIVEELDKASHGMNMKQWRVDDSGLSIRLVSDKFTVEPKVGDLVYAGLDFLDYENSGGLDVRGALFRLACLNGAVVSDISYARNIKKVGWKEPTAIVNAALSYFETTCQEVMSFASSLKGMTEIPFELPEAYEDQEKVVRKPLHLVGVGSKSFDGQVLDALVPEEKTLFGLYNALTALGRDAQGRDVKLMFERSGYKTVTLSGEVKEMYDLAYQALLDE